MDRIVSITETGQILLPNETEKILTPLYALIHTVEGALDIGPATNERYFDWRVTLNPQQINIQCFIFEPQSNQHTICACNMRNNVDLSETETEARIFITALANWDERYDITELKATSVT